MKKLFKYFKECRLEMKKVAWPAKAEVFDFTKVILVMTIVSALLLGLVDFVLLKLVYLIF